MDELVIPGVIIFTLAAVCGCFDNYWWINEIKLCLKERNCVTVYLFGNQDALDKYDAFSPLLTSGKKREKDDVREVKITTSNFHHLYNCRSFIDGWAERINIC